MARPPRDDFWALPEAVAGECRIYDGDGNLLSRTTIDAEGRPVARDEGRLLWRWYRSRRTDGTVRALRVYTYSEASSDRRLVLEESFDHQGHVIAANDDTSTWEYDADGRLLRTETMGGTLDITSYQYDAAGHLVGKSTLSCCEPHLDRSTSQWTWDGDRLLSETNDWSSQDANNSHSSDGVTWTKHHATGMPELGERWRSDGPTTPVEWTYDHDGHPVGFVRGDSPERHRWEWDGDHVVRHEEYSGETWRRTDEWVWDDEGRLVAESAEYAAYGTTYTSTWEWDDDGEYAGGTEGDQVWVAEGDCPNRLIAPRRAVSLWPSPLPVVPEPPKPYGEGSWR